MYNSKFKIQKSKFKILASFQFLRPYGSKRHPTGCRAASGKAERTFGLRLSRLDQMKSGFQWFSLFQAFKIQSSKFKIQN